MNSSKDNSAVLFVIALIAILILSNCSGSNSNIGTSKAQTVAEENQPTDTDSLKDAPDFTLTKMNGESFTLLEHEGKVVVLNIWATWCPPCRKEIPDFIDIQEEMRDEGVLFVGVSQDKEGMEVVRPFAKEYGINYPLVVDDGTVRQKYGPFRGIPTTFIINKKGKVEFVAPGMVNREALQPALEKLANR